MKIAFIKCMTLEENVGKQHGDISDVFTRFFETYKPEISLEIYDAEHGELPDSDLSVDGYLFSGSPHSPCEALPWIEQTKVLIQTLYRNRIPMVGICFGHQMLADALGGRVAKSPEGWGIGIQPAPIRQRMEWMIPYTDAPGIVTSYQDQVEALPSDAVVLSSNFHCPYFMFSIDHRVLGIQGHPEIRENLAADMYRSRMNILGKAPVHKAIRTLEDPVDPTIWANWIYHFFKMSQRQSPSLQV